MVGRGVGSDIKNRMSRVKDGVLEKLTAASVPSDALENARSFFESLIRDVSLAAHGLTIDALHMIKFHLADILPSLSPSVTSEMVDEAEKEAASSKNNFRDDEETEADKLDEHQNRKSLSASPVSRL
ncbi:hypothetical protein RND81_06G096300 [Saponaria officinalis]|uniref:Uncharacterized protein n=1 Tax=Saponaria officinalis TaxID=3572 RepID=A0AAW1K566_SAPOF